ncbi:transcription-repair coupling factor [Treponema vincentii F0403]|uniref:Transcription-repair-coupling factor n=1 Tax=Treponema vincentii F0403 TaxID=1125702 RepID=S3LA84_9SPIR|nr:transcription-repair coupling factor [Treponema vincentii]EPF46391.1 transcription-repair coupling factor [Treponema vincentii F0403]
MKEQTLQDSICSWKTMENAFSSLKEGRFPYHIYGLSGGIFAFFLAEYVRRFGSNLCIVVPTEKEIEELHADLDIAGLQAQVLPWWGNMAYRPVQNSAPVFAERAQMLAELCAGAPITDSTASGSAASETAANTVTVMTQRAFLTPVPPPDYLKTLTCTLYKGKEIDTEKIASLLVQWGYTRVPRVSVRGEFALRGEVLDVCAAANKGSQHTAYRIQFDFNTIEKIKSFDMHTQASVEEFGSLTLYPMKEVIWDDERIASLERNMRNMPEFTADGMEKLIAHVKEHRAFDGEELFYPLCFEKPASILDYLEYLHGGSSAAEPILLYMDYDRQRNAVEALEREYHGLYNKVTRAIDDDIKYNLLITEYPMPQRLLLSFTELTGSYPQSIFLRTLKESDDGGEPIVFNCDPPRSFFGNIVYLKEELTHLQQEGWRIFVFAESDAQALRIGELLKDIKATVLPLTLSSGFGIPELKILVIQENEIFGRRRRIPKSIKQVKSSVIDTFVELNPGDYVVHVNYGIGQFKGIERVKALGHERDYINLLYAQDETVFIPIEQANLVQRYIGNEGEAPRLDIIGSKAWENRKNKVKKSVEDIADKLIDLYSRRKAAAGFAFAKDNEWQTAFEAAFPYEETEDQLTCIADVKTDMEKPVPMDRLICGDVGYGKTEIAMRAAFKAVMSGKQAAFLAPTTILAEQHFETFQERFQKFPVKLARLSRFVSKAEQKKVLNQLKNGELDIVIGTHRVIQKDVQFKDLGLMIVDEEQRFGVKDKERLKQMKTNIDCLSLSATPIPRTLHISLLKIRDMSLLTTPPQNRRPVETVISPFDSERIAQAIRFEVDRGGQVFYLHNRVESLEETRYKIQQLIPEVLIDIAHGQMSATELEDIFRRFNMGGFHVLIATTIIENGIDIPNANTIIIDRADMYGVSQLYQLRGRVGRSDRKAYAYLLYPENKALSEVAMKRLQVISDFTELGSGFKIAMKDMEIRGAGNLLGKEQSGDIYSVGFDLYLRLLEEAVERLQNAGYEPETEPVIELEYTGFIPDSYIRVPETKMEIYKKIAAVRTAEELDRLYAELSDRFGPAPEEAESLLSLAEIKIICAKLAIASLKERNGTVRITFAKVSKISIDKLLRMIKESAGRVKLDAKQPNVIMLETGNIGLKEKSEFISEKLNQLI